MRRPLDRLTGGYTVRSISRRSRSSSISREPHEGGLCKRRQARIQAVRHQRRSIIVASIGLADPVYVCKSVAKAS